MPARFTFNAQHFDKYVERCGGLQAAFDAGREKQPAAARGWGSIGWSRHEFDRELRGRSRPRLGLNSDCSNGSDVIGSCGSSELAVIIGIDLHARCELPFLQRSDGSTFPINLTWGTADVQCFDPFSMTYSGIILRGVPLYMVHGLHFSASLAEARAGATVVACGVARISDTANGDDDDDQHEALARFNMMFEQIIECADVQALSSLVANSWCDPDMSKLVAARQCEADLGARMQAMLLEKAGLADLGGST